MSNRVELETHHYERIFRILETGMSDGVREVLENLRSSIPASERIDIYNQRGASYKQLHYISSLAGFNESGKREFFGVVESSGGLSSKQAGDIINLLLKRKRNVEGEGF